MITVHKLFWMPPHLMNRGSPEVVEEDVGDRCLWSQVSVLFYGTDVVEHESAVQTVVVDQDTSEYQDGTEPAARRLGQVLGSLHGAGQPAAAAASPSPHCRHHPAKTAHSAHPVHSRSFRLTPPY